MQIQSKKGKLLLVLLVSVFFIHDIHAQPPALPIPVEMFFGNKALYFQTVVKRPFTAESKFDFFTLATYTADYENELGGNSLVMINQLSYNLKKGFGVMAGVDMNSAVGFSPIFGPQHTFASAEWLTVTVFSWFLNGDDDIKILGIYEYKPKFNSTWGMYNRLQLMYNHSLGEAAHNRSYLFLRTGLKWNAMGFGLAVNLDQYGPAKNYDDNYGAFVRWEF